MKKIIGLAILVILVSISLCRAENYRIKSQTIRVVTAYNVGDVNQCDSDPCIAANNKNICEALDRGEQHCAANFVPLGTTLHIDKIGYCLVTDRTNSRYRNRVDIAMKKSQYKEALNFGRQKLRVKILATSK